MLQFQLFHMSPIVVGLLLLGLLLFAFVAGGILGPKLFAAIGLPGLSLGVQVTETLDTKLKALIKTIEAKRAAQATLGLPPEQIEPIIQAAVTEHLASTK